MPVFVQWSSKIAPGQKIDLPNMLSDWMPTFLDAAGATAPQRADGISILPILTGMAKQQKILLSTQNISKKDIPQLY